MLHFYEKRVVDKTLYDILEVEPDATIDEIKKAVRKKLLQHHPDRGGDYEIFKKIHSAQEVLTDPEKRKIYDLYGLEGLKCSQQESGFEFAQFFGGCSEGAASTLGFAVGGAKDVNNFRQNIENNYLPAVTDVSYEGLFNDYFFDTGNQHEINDGKQLFCPTYSMAVTENPLQMQNEQQLYEYYMTVGLNSNLNEETYKRSPMNLVICIDVSGSMSSPFDRYHYDQRYSITSRDKNTEYDTQSKMQTTVEVISKVLDHLKPNDRVAITTFNDAARVIQTMEKVTGINISQLKYDLSKIRAGGGTNMSAGIECSASLFKTASLVSDDDYDNRILFLTDAQPNQGYLGGNDFYSPIEELAKQRVYTTFIGVGIDLNTELISLITKQRGANYFSVHDSEKFLQLLDKDFDLILTPLVFNVEMKLESDLFDVEHIYGSPECDAIKQGQLIKINTLFPSRTDDNQRTRGGVVLLKLKAKRSTTDIFNTAAHLSLTYEDRLGKKYEEKQLIYILLKNETYYANSGIRKAILLVNYVTLLKQWIIHERERKYNEGETSFDLKEKNAEMWSLWERQSTRLTVSSQYREQFETFLTYFQSEMALLHDNDLEQEVKIMVKLINYDETNDEINDDDFTINNNISCAQQ